MGGTVLATMKLERAVRTSVLAAIATTVAVLAQVRTSGPSLPAQKAASLDLAGDQAPAILANFPVPAGAVRKWFSSSRSKSSWQERATFGVALTPDLAVNNYGQQLAAAGWSETSRSQTGDPAAQTLQFTLDLRKALTHAHVVLTQNAGESGVAVTVTTQFPGSSAPPLAAGTTAAPATGATASPSDRGTRDPADLPRLAGSVRTSYGSTSQMTSTQEVATYAAKCAPASADAFYAQSLAGANWEQITRYEETNDVAKSDLISMTWQAPARSVAITLNGSTAGGVEVRTTLTGQTKGASTASGQSAQEKALAERLAAELSAAGIPLSSADLNELVDALVKGGQAAVAVATSLLQSIAEVQADHTSQESPGATDPVTAQGNPGSTGPVTAPSIQQVTNIITTITAANASSPVSQFLQKKLNQQKR